MRQLIDTIRKVGQSDKRVLLVLGDHDRRSSVKYLLESKGFGVDVADGGFTALKMIQEDNSYDVIISEIFNDSISALGLHMFAKRWKRSVRTIVLNDKGTDYRNVANEFGIDTIVDLPIENPGGSVKTCTVFVFDTILSELY